MATAAKFILPIPIFLAYLVPLDVDVTGNITAKICEVWSEFSIFCTLDTNFTWHMIFLQCFIKFDRGISEKSSGQKCVEEE
jgi:hypothetical protein